MNTNTTPRKAFLNDFIVSVIFFAPTFIVLTIACTLLASEAPHALAVSLLLAAMVLFFVQFGTAHKSRFLRKFLADQE